MAETDVDEVLVIIGFGWVHVFMVIACGILLISVLNEVIGMSLLVVSIRAEFEMTSTDVSVVQMAAVAGMLISSHFMGYQMDKIGRKKMIVLSSFLVIAFSTVSALVPSFWIFVFWRFMVGIASSGCTSGNLTYLAENIKVKWRPHILVYMSYFSGLSFMYTAGAAMLIMPEDSVQEEEKKITYYWRVLLNVFNIPACICLAMFLYLPETPKFLLSIRKYDEAYAVLDWLCRKKHGVGLDQFGVSSITQPNIQTESEEKNFCKDIWQGTLPLFRPPYVFGLSICLMILATLFAMGNGLSVWFPYIRNCKPIYNNLTLCELFQDSMTNKKDSTITECPDQLKNMDDPFIYGCVTILLHIVVSILLFIIRRRLIIFVCLIVSAGCGFVLNFIKDDTTILIFFIVYVVFPPVLIVIVNMIVIDYMPTHMRGKALGLGLFLARIVGISMNTVIGFFMGTYCYYITNGLIVALVLAAFVSFLGPS